METQYIGKPITRVDSLEKVTGQALYGFDMDLPGMLYGATLRSPFPHAMIKNIDISEAKVFPGVRAVVTGKDFPFTIGMPVRDRPFLAIDRVRYAGEPVVAVAADTEMAAHAALELICIEYEELAAVSDPREALQKGAPLVHPEIDNYANSGAAVFPGTNLSLINEFALGDIESGFQEADEIFEDEFSAHPVSHTAMETHTAVVRYSALGAGAYTIWTSTDRPYIMHRELTAALGISANQARIIVPYTGGSFGGKNTLVAEAIGISLARYTNGRPVKVIFSREEDLTASSVRVGSFMKLKTGVKRDGTLTARMADIVWDNGAYTNNAGGVAIRGAQTILGPYRIPNVALTSRLVYTNSEPSGSYRGYGTTQVSWACESQMDIIADRLGMDPLEIRLKNGFIEGDHYINGQVLHSVGLTETLKKSAHEIGWGKVTQSNSPTKRRGKGIATMLKGTLTPTSSSCFIKMDRDASVTVICSVPEIGAGQKTILSQIVAETIGIPIESISISEPDTSITPFNDAVGSSRTTFHMGNAVRIAGQHVRDKILKLAGSILETDPDRVHLSEGIIFGHNKEKLIDLKDLLSLKLGTKGEVVLGEGYYNPVDSPLLAADEGLRWMSSIFWMFATHTVEVEVDIETGEVTVLKVAAAHDVGQAINPIACEQQIEGSVIMGISNTLMEEFKMEGGRILNDNLADYKIATMLDVPDIVPIIVEAHHREGPFGAKGVGEPAAAATAPAISNAIFDAVGIRIKDLPITQEKVLLALKQIQQNRKP